MSVTADLELSRTVHLQALGTLSGGVPAGLPDQLGELTPVVVAFDEARTTIEADANLSAVGKQTKVAEARATATSAIETWATGKTGGIDRQIESQRRTLQETATPPQPSEFAIKFMAEKLVTLDPLEVEVLYHDATPQERVTIEAAVESVGRVPRRRGADGAVVWEHLMNPERLASSRTARQAQANPAVAASLADLNRISNCYSALASAALALLK